MIQIYLMGNKEYNFYKIGISKHPGNRLREINVPFSLSILSTYEIPEQLACYQRHCKHVGCSSQVEKKLHDYYKRANKHLRNEWFHDISVEDFNQKVAEFHTDSSPLPKLVSEWDTYSSGQRRELLLAKPSPALDKILKEATRKYEAAI